MNAAGLGRQRQQFAFVRSQQHVDDRDVLRFTIRIHLQSVAGRQDGNILENGRCDLLGATLGRPRQQDVERPTRD